MTDVHAGVAYDARVIETTGGKSATVVVWHAGTLGKTAAAHLRSGRRADPKIPNADRSTFRCANLRLGALIFYGFRPVVRVETAFGAMNKSAGEAVSSRVCT